MSPDYLLPASLAEALARAILHSLWLGTVIAGGAWMFLTLLKIRSAHARHAVYFGALALTVLSFAGLVVAQHPAYNAAPAPARSVEAVGQAARPFSESSAAPGRSPLEGPAGGSDGSGPSAGPDAGAQGPAPITPLPWRAWLATAYLLGLGLMLLRVAAAAGASIRLRSRAEPVAEPALLEALERQVRAIGLCAAPALAWCRRTAVPAVAGVLRPVILLPASYAAGGVPIDQLELILAHELAHIRRLDPLMNLLQSLAEAVLFYHPAMWFLSHRIRAERENACDDLVVTVHCSPARYAATLIEAAARATRPEAASAQLVHAVECPSALHARVLRLLYPESLSAMRPSARGMGMGALALLLFLGAAIGAARGRGEEQSTGEPDRGASILLREAHLLPREGDAPFDLQIRDKETGEPVPTLDEIEAALKARRAALNRPWRIVYERSANDVVDAPRRTEYVTLLTDGADFREESREQSQGPVTETRIRFRGRRVRITPGDGANDPRSIRYETYNLGFDVENLLGRNLFGSFAELFAYFRECEVAGTLAIERVDRNGLEVVSLSAGGAVLELAPSLGWAVVRYRDTQFDDFARFDGVYLPRTATWQAVLKNFPGSGWDYLATTVSVRSVEANVPVPAGALAIPEPAPGTEVQLSYPVWDPRWGEPATEGDGALTEEAIRNALPDREQQFVWSDELSQTERDIWGVARWWHDPQNVEAALAGSPLAVPFMARTLDRVLCGVLKSEVDGPMIVHGRVADVTPDTRPERWTELEKAMENVRDYDEAEAVWMRMWQAAEAPPPSNVVVTARSRAVTRRTRTDGEGAFRFYNLPEGIYTLSASIPARPEWTGAGRIASAAATERVVETYGHVQLGLHAGRITVTGRVIDEEGRPIAGARVRGEPHPYPEVSEITPDTQYAVTDAEGRYVLEDLPPMNLWKIAGYLGGGDPSEGGQYAYGITVLAEADGYVQPRDEAPKVPLISQELLGPARELARLTRLLAAKAGVEENVREREDVHLPPGHDNVITDVDIVMHSQP